jgi:hypothetical protein
MCKVNSALRPRDDPPFMDCEMLFYYHWFGELSLNVVISSFQLAKGQYLVPTRSDGWVLVQQQYSTAVVQTIYRSPTKNISHLLLFIDGFISNFILLQLPTNEHVVHKTLTSPVECGNECVFSPTQQRNCRLLVLTIDDLAAREGVYYFIWALLHDFVQQSWIHLQMHCYLQTLCSGIRVLRSMLYYHDVDMLLCWCMDQDTI